MKINVYNTILNEETRHNELKIEKSIICEDSNKLKSPSGVQKLMIEQFQLHKKAEEYVYLVSLDMKCNPLGIFELSHGTVNISLIMPREIFIRALLSGAVGIIIIHNHPSSDITPSSQDLLVTEKIAQAGKMIGVELLDHIIIGGNEYCSLKEMGVL
ncbi:MAG TPA: DNA repair protein RadC [Lachnoclostridium phytofermentans]|uniref:DNA repair protein RadC n=1 Tax=Lachnoclostridium phytofermentans TaxID=66219 RepID=A0A3D2X2R4_9FIRM|nr:JAB domain-containing protein [Lachnoclostridium sp.]HCL01266.1 DNA repair protein RadC [Lachnoclostridium phytofermentans]